MNYLCDIIAKKTDLSKYEIDAILKIAGQEILSEIREGKSVHIDGFGYFAPKINDKGIYIVVSLTNSAKETLNKNNKKERSDEIIFE